MDWICGTCGSDVVSSRAPRSASTPAEIVVTERCHNASCCNARMPGHAWKIPRS